MTLRDLGLPQLSSQWSRDAREDAFNAILNAEAPVVFSLIEALIALLLQTRQPFGDVPEVAFFHYRRFLPQFIQTVRTILHEHRVSFDLIDGNFVPRESLEMHESVVIPVLTLLGGRRGFDGAETAYQKALSELHTGSPDDAITDAGTALQETLVALGCSGNSLGPLAKSAINKGVITGYDGKIVDWVSADRSSKGDAHNAKPASREDAWLAVHVVGALILRIADGPLRSSQR